jgi:SAM-dependent methyltransferase
VRGGGGKRGIGATRGGAGVRRVEHQPPAQVDPDVVHASGVVHHIPDPVPVVEAMAGWLAPGGELRLMLYTDVCWRLVTGTEPPEDVTGHPLRERYVREMDQVGEWADWYSPQRLVDRFGKWFELEDAQYISPNSRYMTAVMVKR